MTIPASHHYLRHPHFVSWAPSHAKHATAAVRACAFDVLRVLSPGSWPQVGKCVIRPISVNVVQYVFWPYTTLIKPRKSVCSVKPAADVDFNITAPLAFASCNAPDEISSSAGLQPNKRAQQWVVMQQLAQTLRSKIGLSHDAVLSLIGQRPVSVSALRGPRYFIRSYAAANGRPAEIPSKPWKDRIGWSRVLAGLRKAYQRLPGPRSDFWW